MSITFGLIGEQLGHSFSAPIHKRLGIGNYALHSMPKEDVGPLLVSRKFSGLNVTIPYKELVMPYCDVLSETALAVGSVNTLVVRPDGTLFGDNTDLFGFLYMANRANISLAGKKVLILGSGGTAKTAKAAALAEGAREIVTVSRTGQVTYGDLPNHADADVLVNTTPVGMFPDVFGIPVELSAFPRLAGVIDVVYNPLQTVLLQQAKARNIPNTGGLSMLVAQAVRSASKFLQKEFDDSAIEEALSALQAEMTNIVLIGMPGSGKTTIAAALAAQTGRKLVDTDDLIEEAAGRPIPEIINTHGEAHFRQREAEAVAKAAFQTGVVIATGGGAVLLPKNIANLRRNGLVFFLHRKVENLAATGRPLSGGVALRKALLAARLPAYWQACDFVIGNEDVAASVSAIRRKLDETFDSQRA